MCVDWPDCRYCRVRFTTYLRRAGVRNVRITVEEAEAHCSDALMQAGAPESIAAKVAYMIVRNETDGHCSHGVLRVLDYLADANSGALDVKAVPQVRRISDSVRVIDGQRGFGVLAADNIISQMGDVLRTADIGAVALVNSHHIGRLYRIGEAIGKGGNAVLGFVNYLGAGQRMPPWNGQQERLCTNPIMIAFPTEHEPFVLDMTTTTVAEGKIRERALTGRRVPKGWLIDKNWKPVTDPMRLYTKPPTAYMVPLGGKFGYKGYGLALAVEVLAGIVTGAGFAQDGVCLGGNGGLFIGLRPEAFGRLTGDFISEVEQLRNYLKKSPAAKGEIRFPGEASSPARRTRTEVISVNRKVWEEIVQHANGVSSQGAHA